MESGSVAATSSEARSAVAAASGIEAVLRAMAGHGGSVPVQHVGCSALWSLAHNNKRNAVSIEQAGGLVTIANARKAFPSEDKVTEMADGAVKAIETSKRS